MNLSKFKFHAFTNKGMEKVLQKELQHIIKKPQMSFIFGKYGIEFRANFEEILEILKTSQMLNSLKVQIGHPFLAVNEKMFKNKLDGLNFKAWLDLQSIQQQPQVITSSINSDLYHEKMISDIVQSHLEKIYFKPQVKSSLTDDEIRLLASMHFKQLSEHQENQKIDQEQKQLVAINTPTKKKIYVAVYKNNVCISLELFNEMNYKSGFKPYIGKGSVKENIIHGFLEKSGLLKKFINNKKVKIVDPFCGSGTILIQSIVSSLNLKIRHADITNSDLKNLPLFKNTQEINDLIDNFQNDKENEGLQVQLIGCDINQKQYENCVDNFRNLDHQNVLKKVAPCDKKVILDLKDNLRQKKIKFKSFYNKVLLINTSFEKFIDNSYYIEDQILLTNIPYGKQCKVDKDLYKNFDNFLKQSHKRFKKIFILNLDNNKDMNYLIQSQFDWKLVFGFYNDGQKMGFFRFTNKKNTRIKKKDIVKITQEKGRKKKRTITLRYDLNKIDQIVPNSKIMKDRLKLLKRKRRNLYLLRHKKYEDKKSQMIQDNIAVQDQKQIKDMMTNFKSMVTDNEKKKVEIMLKKKGLLDK